MIRLEVYQAELRKVQKAAEKLKRKIGRIKSTLDPEFQERKQQLLSKEAVFEERRQTLLLREVELKADIKRLFHPEP